MARYAIGDIHGFAEPLRVLLEQVELTQEDTLVFLGDYVDKGPDVAGVLEQLVCLSGRANTIFLRGNHDQLFLNAYQNLDAVSVWECLAGVNPLSSYANGSSPPTLQSAPENHITFLKLRCRNFYSDDDFIFVHGGIQSHVDPAGEEVDRLQWTTLSQAVPHHSGKTIVCGHSSQKSGQIADLGHTICIDTGITSGGKLTCLNLDDRAFIQVSEDLDVTHGHLPKSHIG